MNWDMTFFITLTSDEAEVILDENRSNEKTNLD